MEMGRHIIEHFSFHSYLYERGKTIEQGACYMLVSISFFSFLFNFPVTWSGRGGVTSVYFVEAGKLCSGNGW